MIYGSRNQNSKRGSGLTEPAALVAYYSCYCPPRVWCVVPDMYGMCRRLPWSWGRWRLISSCFAEHAARWPKPHEDLVSVQFGSPAALPPPSPTISAGTRPVSKNLSLASISSIHRRLSATTLSLPAASCHCRAAST